MSILDSTNLKLDQQRTTLIIHQDLINHTQSHALASSNPCTTITYANRAEFSLSVFIEAGFWLARESHHWGLILLVHLWCDSKSGRKCLVVLCRFLVLFKSLVV